MSATNDFLGRVESLEAVSLQIDARFHEVRGQIAQVERTLAQLIKLVEKLGEEGEQ